MWGRRGRSLLIVFNYYRNEFLLVASSSMSTFSIIALLLSVFNIIDMLVSNANNNNNRNNINQNDFNANDNSNTESNANPDQASSNAVKLKEYARRRKFKEFWGEH